MAKRSISEVFPRVNGPAALSTFHTFVKGEEKKGLKSVKETKEKMRQRKKLRP